MCVNGRLVDERRGGRLKGTEGRTPKKAADGKGYARRKKSQWFVRARFFGNAGEARRKEGKNGGTQEIWP